MNGTSTRNDAQVALRVDQLKKNFGRHEVPKGVTLDALEDKVIDDDRTPDQSFGRSRSARFRPFISNHR
ncbi:hypothetical protein DPV79_10715 [Burkholderia reimsis]|uniref:Uncharacterized protein n=1 Tax=Burkholderia reimsis TaxID=2234132 RepID=A0A365QXB5_9BURK|nr:hypothetical protein [Burkholderia reimsis]RBB40344.1 hypothetical protein DPV79_10715 [Burkholderia reimsis]